MKRDAVETKDYRVTFDAEGNLDMAWIHPEPYEKNSVLLFGQKEFYNLYFAVVDVQRLMVLKAREAEHDKR